jgi:D-serine deaminase-like pyridoxal phosphate-dependent protein
VVHTRRLPIQSRVGRFHDDIGRGLDEIATPALVLERAAVLRNIETMARRMEAVTAGLRPHIKVHKSTEMARMQVAAGASGVTTATVAEAVAMVEGGIPDVLVANEVVDAPSFARLLEAARSARVRVAVDDIGVLERSGRAATEAGVEIGVLVEVDVGLGRGGTRSPDDAVNLARLADATPGITFDGLMGYEGHCASEPDAALRSAEALRSMERLGAVMEACHRSGLSVDTVSAGATGTFETTGNAPGVTEIQAGSYVVMDHFHAPLVDGFAFALTVMASVIARHGSLLVLDAGRKCVDVSLRPLQPPDPRATLAFLHEEHLGLRYEGEAPGAIGDRVRIVPGYAPTTVNLFGVYHVVEDGRVVDVWPVLARHGTP